jgi:hypothetical protein
MPDRGVAVATVPGDDPPPPLRVRTGPDRIGPDRAGLDWTGPDRTRVAVGYLICQKKVCSATSSEPIHSAGGAV